MVRTWDKTELYQLYHTERKTLRCIASLKDVSHEAIRLQMKKLGIQRRQKWEVTVPRKKKTWVSLDYYLLCHPNSGWGINDIPKELLPSPLHCQDCHSTKHLRILRIVYPATSTKDINILCCSCLMARYKKGMTWARQIDLYRDRLVGVKLKDLATKYNIHRSMVCKILRKLTKYSRK